MNIKNTSEKKRMIFIFAGFYSSSVFLLILILTVLWENSSSINGPVNNKNRKLSGEQQVVLADKLLHDYASGLQVLDEKYVSLLVDSGIRANFDKTSEKIRLTELAFRMAIDSIDKVSVGRNAAKFSQLLSAYRAILDNRRVIDTFQRAVASGSRQINKDQQTLSKLKDDLLQKNTRTAELENHVSPSK